MQDKTKKQKKDKKAIKVQVHDLKPKKDAKGGGGPPGHLIDHGYHGSH
jgi:hypothetical protein